MESRGEKRLRCWESVFAKGVIEAQCPVCQCSVVRYTSTSGNTFQQLHVVPASKQGSDQSWNLVPGCGCNQNMRHMNLVDWMGTRGNKQQLLKALFLAKYKSLVPPCYRTLHDREQLIKWVYKMYRPSCLEEYRDWLMLLDSDLATIQRDDCVKVEVKCKEEQPADAPPAGGVKMESLPPTIAVPVDGRRDSSSEGDETSSVNVTDIVDSVPMVKSPYFERTYHYNVRTRLAHTSIHARYL
jgi:hypothetical protein